MDLKFPDGCGSTNDFSGSYASKTRELSLAGAIDMFDEDCEKIGELSMALRLKK